MVNSVKVEVNVNDGVTILVSPIAKIEYNIINTKIAVPNTKNTIAKTF